jgi:NTE family protein
MPEVLWRQLPSRHRPQNRLAAPRRGRFPAHTMCATADCLPTSYLPLPRSRRGAVLIVAGLMASTVSAAAARPQDPPPVLLDHTPVLRPMHGLPFLEPDRPLVGVALSGGGSRGMAHIGTLLALEEAGLAPHFIAGTSSGAIIGGLYAAGYTPAELAEMVGRVPWRQLFSDRPEPAHLFLAQREERATYTLQVRFDGLRPIFPTSYITGQRMQSLLSSLALRGEYRAGGVFSNLRVPFAAISTDLLSGERVMLTSGSITEALLASSAIPVLVAAVRRDGRMLVDGGLVDALPVEAVIDMGADLVVASDVSAALRPIDKLGNPL